MLAYVVRPGRGQLADPRAIVREKRANRLLVIVRVAARGGVRTAYDGTAAVVF